jgi:peroxiredoxin
MRRFIRVLFLLAFFLLGNAPNGGAQFFEAGVQKLEPPIPAPDFTLNKLDGGRTSLKTFRGKIVILNFFAPWCEVCQKESSSFEHLKEDIKNKDVVFLRVAVKSNPKEAREFKKEFHVSSPMLIDKKGAVAKAYRVFGHHETFFINRKGKIVGRTFAERDWASESMRELIQYLLTQDR